MIVFGDKVGWRCPFCHEDTLKYGRDDSLYFVGCTNCGAQTGRKQNKPDVRKAAEYPDGFSIKPEVNTEPEVAEVKPVSNGSMRGKRARVFDVIEEEQ